MISGLYDIINEIFSVTGSERKMKMEADIDTLAEYNEFLRDNRIKVNRYLNKVLWFFVFTGPAIASGIHGGIFKDITYTTCIGISLIVILMSSIHLFLFKKFPCPLVLTFI